MRETIVNGNYAPYNFQFIAGDILPAVLLLVLAQRYYRHACKKG